MDSVILFFSFFAGIGILQFYDSYRIWGPFSKYISIDFSFSVIEVSWLSICIIVLISGILNGHELALPLAYITYHLVFGGLGLHNALLASSFQDLALTTPKTSLILSSLLGPVLFISSIYFIVTHESLNPGLGVLEFIILNMWNFIFAFLSLACIYGLYRLLKHVGRKEFLKQIHHATNADKEITEIFGVIESIILNVGVTKKCDEHIYAFDITGTNESGLFIAEVHNQGADKEVIAAGIAYLDNGKTIELTHRAIDA